MKRRELVKLLAGAAMCSAFERGTFWPLAIMPSADQVPVNTSHSMILWPMWVVLIAGSTAAALRAVRLPNRYVTPGFPV